MKLGLLSFNSYKKEFLSPINFAGALRAACLERMPSSDIFESQHTENAAYRTNNENNKKISKSVVLNNENRRVLKNVLLKDAKAGKVEASIVQYDDDPDIYSVCIDKKGFETPVCKMLVKDKGDCVFIDYIEKNEKYDQIEGAGTELIKFAAEQSMKMGYGGKVELFAIASFPFYFKNNFRVEKSFLSSERDAYYSYMTRNKIDVPKSLPSIWCDSDFVLTEDAAAALLNNERLYENDLYETEYDKTLNYIDESEKCTVKVDVDFCETTNSSFLHDGNKEYVIQLIQRDDKQISPVGALKVKLLENDGGRKYLNVENLVVDETYDVPHGKGFYDAVKRELFETAAKKAEKLGAEYIKYNKLNIKLQK